MANSATGKSREPRRASYQSRVHPDAHHSHGKRMRADDDICAELTWCLGPDSEADSAFSRTPSAGNGTSSYDADRIEQSALELTGSGAIGYGMTRHKHRSNDDVASCLACRAQKESIVDDEAAAEPTTPPGTPPDPVPTTPPTRHLPRQAPRRTQRRGHR